MYKLIRKKLAKSVSNIQASEDFEWRKWLKEPSLQEEKIEGFVASLEDTDHLNQWLEKPSYEKRQVILQEVVVLPELKDFSSRKTKTNLVFFGFGSPDVKKFKPEEYETDYKHKPQEIKFRNKSINVKSIDCEIPNSMFKNQPWELKPEIIKIDLLNADMFSIEKNRDNIINVELAAIAVPPKIYKDKILSLSKIKQTRIYFLKNINVKQAKLLGNLANIFVQPDVFEPNLNILGMKQETIEEQIPEADSIEDTVSNINIVEKISSIEEVYVETEQVPNVNIIDELAINNEEQSEDNIEQENEDDINYENVFESLYNFQKEGAEFLLEHKRALLSDELGLGKTVQAVSTLKNLFESGRIKSALIICTSDRIGSVGRLEGHVDGWIGHLHKRVPELNVVHLSGSIQERKKKWQSAPDILISTYDNFFFDIVENVAGSKELKHFNCLVLDEVQFLFNRKFDGDKFLKSMNPKYIMALSSIPNENVKNNLDSIFKNKFSIKSYLRRSKKDVVKETPGVVWQNKWLEMDEDQAVEYNDAFISAKEKVSWLLESGNPLRFNANIFTILHQLKQICNFSANSIKSPKTELLTRQIEFIAKNNKKVVVFSQYDKAGTKKIEEILNKSGIKYLSYAPGMSTKEMESTTKNFISKSSITAMIVGVKPGRMKIASTEIPYVIHFDLWWNPASLWQTETVLRSARSALLSENLSVYSYLMKGTIEERINNLLFRKGLLNKNVMENIAADTIAEMVANEEWLEVFDMPDNKFKNMYEAALQEIWTKIENYSEAELMEKGKNLFTKLGYRNLDLAENNNGGYFDMRGIIKKANYDQQMNARFVFNDYLESEEIKNHLTELREKTNNGKVFLISKGTFEMTELILPNATLIDHKLLANYFYQFRVM